MTEGTKCRWWDEIECKVWLCRWRQFALFEFVTIVLLVVLIIGR